MVRISAGDFIRNPFIGYFRYAIDSYSGNGYKSAPLRKINQDFYETDFSAQQASTQTPSWFPGAHGFRRRPQGVKRPPGERPQAPVRLSVGLATIKKRRDFLSAFAKGKKFVTGTFILQMLLRDEAHPAASAARFGFTVTKKMGNAVARNRIKRRLRAAVRQVALKQALAGHDYVVISRHKALDCPFSDLLRDMEFAFSRIHTMKESHGKKS